MNFSCYFFEFVISLGFTNFFEGFEVIILFSCDFEVIFLEQIDSGAFFLSNVSIFDLLLNTKLFLYNIGLIS